MFDPDYRIVPAECAVSVGRKSNGSRGRGIGMVDSDGFRPNVGIIVANDQGQVLWARRVGGFDAWQFPQGGINTGESVEDALYRELKEEVGLQPDAVKVLAHTRGWLRYRLPRRLRRRRIRGACLRPEACRA